MAVPFWPWGSAGHAAGPGSEQLAARSAPATSTPRAWPRVAWACAPATAIALAQVGALTRPMGSSPVRARPSSPQVEPRGARRTAPPVAVLAVGRASRACGFTRPRAGPLTRRAIPEPTTPAVWRAPATLGVPGARGSDAHVPRAGVRASLIPRYFQGLGIRVLAPVQAPVGPRLEPPSSPAALNAFRSL